MIINKGKDTYEGKRDELWQVNGRIRIQQNKKKKKKKNPAAVMWPHQIRRACTCILVLVVCIHTYIHTLYMCACICIWSIGNIFWYLIGYERCDTICGFDITLRSIFHVAISCLFKIESILLRPCILLCLNTLFIFIIFSQWVLVWMESPYKPEH